jgi:SAM-dependent methyltransferase
MCEDAVKSFEELISEAEAWELKGWDFSSLADRWVEPPPPWNYRARVLARLRRSTSMLDMGTGGGEFLSSLQPLPSRTCATEGYPPNVPIARERLGPLGVEVVRTYIEDNAKIPQRGGLPFRTSGFDLVINRHESFVAREVFRVLGPSGRFLTQQVGSENLIELNRLLGAERPSVGEWNLDVAIRQLEDAGFRIAQGRRASLASWFKDVGAVVCCLRAVPWQIPDFSVQGYISELRRLDESIRRKGGLEVKAMRFFLEAYKERPHVGEGHAIRATRLAGSSTLPPS